MTHDQHVASDPALSAWVSASAGTGKTKVLTDRVLRLLLAGADPSRILCITYTRAASAEMESRIYAELGAWAAAEDEALERALAALTGKTPDAKMIARARRLFAIALDISPRLRIQTIHGFCKSVLARFPLEAQVPPHFTAIDEITARELLGEAKAALFMSAGSRGSEALAGALAELISHIGEASLYELMAQIIAQRRAFSEWFAVAEMNCHSREGGNLSKDPRLRGDDNMCAWQGTENIFMSSIHTALGLAVDTNDEALRQKYLRYTEQEERELRQACETLARSDAETDKETFLALREWLEKRDNPQGYSTAYITQKGTPRKKLFTSAVAKQWPQIGPLLMAEQSRMLAWSEESKSLRIAQLSGHMATLAQAMLTLYGKLKARHAYLDYDDLILYTVRLLHRPGVAPWVLYKLDGGIDHLLIDEAQDTAPEQWRIAMALAEEFFAGAGARSLNRTLFVVGDEKQSIFSFQGADPLGFDAMRRKLSKLITDSGKDYRRVRLALSFRSTRPVLEAIDSVFAHEQARDGLIFGEGDIRHEVSRIAAAGRVELWPLTEAQEEGPLPVWHVPDKPSYTPRTDLRCAEYMAETIGAWLEEKRLLASKGRAVRPGDIMVLVQRRGVFADALLRALKRRGIAVAGADRLLLTEHIAVMDCMALVRFLLLPQDDLTLAEVLRSPFIGLTEEALFELAYGRGKESLWARLRDFAQGGFNSQYDGSSQCLKSPPPAGGGLGWGLVGQCAASPPLNLPPLGGEIRGVGKNCYNDAFTYLSDLLALTDYMPPYELFAHVLETGGRRKLAARLGEEIADPLNEFLSLALDYGKTHPPSLQGFIHWLETGEIEIKRDMEKGRDEVRILTVHGAKGLQAPIVFLPDTTRMPLNEGGIYWTAVEPSVPLWSPTKDYDDRHYRQLREAKRLEGEREYRRLLYVALTRAEDELYVCGWKGSRAVAQGCWYELVRHAAQGWQAEGDKRILVSAQMEPVKAKPDAGSSLTPEALPAWVHRPAPDEPVPARPLAPSRMKPVCDGIAPFEGARFERGLLVHRLLQYLPEVAADKRRQALETFFTRYGTQLQTEEKQRIGEEVLAILSHPEFAPVFGADSVAEASIAGISGKAGAVMAGRIDRLAVLERDVYIVDYKTGRRIPATPASVPEAYLRQMEAYKSLVEEIYPDKTVHCALLWTAGPKLMLLPEALLQSLAA